MRAYLQTPYNQRPVRTYNKECLDAYVPNKTFYLSVPDRDWLYTAGNTPGAPMPAGAPEAVMAMAESKNIPQEDREGVMAYVGAQFKGRHEGNAIRYRLRPDDLTGLVQD